MLLLKDASAAGSQQTVTTAVDVMFTPSKHHSNTPPPARPLLHLSRVKIGFLSSQSLTLSGEVHRCGSFWDHGRIFSDCTRA